jgi:hypothetical protein
MDAILLSFYISYLVKDVIIKRQYDAVPIVRSGCVCAAEIKVEGNKGRRVTYAVHSHRTVNGVFTGEVPEYPVREKEIGNYERH